ncbi:FAD-dependent monooxygenase [Nonomuraea thailandensis]
MIPLVPPSPTSPTTPAGEPQPSIAIVGGSITGPALALLLHQAGFTRVSVLEASPTPYAQSGGVIGLDHVSLATLDALGISQEELVPFPSERVTAIHIADRRETRRSHFVHPGRNTGWHQLNTALLNRLPGGWLQPGRRVRALRAADDGTALLDLAGATPARRRGRVRRRAPLPRPPPARPSRPLRYAGYVAWRGQLPGHLPGQLPDLCAFTRFEPASSQFNLFPILRKDGTTAVDWTLYLNMTSRHFRHLIGYDPTEHTYLLPHQIGTAARTVVLAEAERLLPHRPPR